MATEIEAPITGNVWKVQVKVGDRVEEGDTLIIFESMKMEIPLEAEDPGTIVEVRVSEGVAVTEGDLIILLDEA